MFFDLSFNPMEPNAMAMYVMQSDYDTQRVIEKFYEYIDKYNDDPDEAIQNALDYYGVCYNDLTDNDKYYIQKTLDKMRG